MRKIDRVGRDDVYDGAWLANLSIRYHLSMPNLLILPAEQPSQNSTRRASFGHFQTVVRHDFGDCRGVP